MYNSVQIWQNARPIFSYKVGIRMSVQLVVVMNVNQSLPWATVSTMTLTMDARKSSLDERE